METFEKIRRLIAECEKTVAEDDVHRRLPQNSYFLSDDRVLCLPRKGGESRYPYDEDGFVVWAYQNGYITCVDSIFTILRSSNYGEEPVVNFFAGVKRADGLFDPISIMGGASTLYEPEDLRRYTVFAPRSVCYIADTSDLTFAVRMSVGRDKRINFAVTAENKTDGEKNVYIGTFVEALLRFMESEGFWDRMSKFGALRDDGALLWSRNGKFDCLSVAAVTTEGEPSKIERTVSRAAFVGAKGRTIANAESLKTGAFDKYIAYVNTTDLPAAASYFHYDLAPHGRARVDIAFEVHHGYDDVSKVVITPPDPEAVEREIDEREREDGKTFANLHVKFGDFEGADPAVVENFTRQVQKQTSFCALGNNYAGPNIGFRDVMQQLEGSLMWDPVTSREKIVRAMNYMMTNGRVPRQFSIPRNKDEIPDFDLRMYVDQGVWAITAIYTYISFTGDKSILDEVCGYYTPSDDKWAVRLSDERDDVLDHLLRITDFFIENIADDTGCIRALYGDWNDALDGLGRTSDPGRKYGDGASVMTTLQFYENLFELTEMIKLAGRRTERVDGLLALREKIAKSLEKYAVATDGDGRRRVIHGWGDKRGYFVGSTSDFDGAARYSLTSNAFWIISGMVKRDPTMRQVIKDAAAALDSKYGLMTFDVPFKLEDRPFVGRLATITKGTYENCCAYVHAGMFGTMALFMAGESRLAWEEMLKALVITHDNCTMTTFVMPNSYCRNEELYIDGVSMGDWYTGSGTMYVKELVRFGLGIDPDLYGVRIQTPSYLPSKHVDADLLVKGKKIKFSYRNEGRGERAIFVDGVKAETAYDKIMDIPVAYVNNCDVTDGMKIEVVD